MLDTSFLTTSIFNVANVNAEKIFNSIAEDEKEASLLNGRKRRRLDDFTPQERMIRRKLKNRVAAQSARDRKRERMTELETVVKRLETENQELKKSNEELKTSMKYLIEQNKELRVHMGIDSTSFDSDHTYTQKDKRVAVSENHVVMKKEEVNVEHAEETTRTSCFLDHDVVSESKTDELLDLLGQIEPGEILEINAEKESRKQVGESLRQDVQVCRGAPTDQPHADLSSLSAEDTNELFQLCQDIRDMVGKPANIINDTPFFLELFDSEGDITEATDTKNTSVQHTLLPKDDNLCCTPITGLPPLDSLFDNTINHFDDIASFLDNSTVDENSESGDSMDDLLSDLFPSLL